MVTGDGGEEIKVTGWHLLTGIPRQVTTPGISGDVHGWAGPWPVVERWWDAGSARRAARLQVVVRNEEAVHTAMLLLREGGRWLVEGIYD
jgi:protein ImuB